MGIEKLIDAWIDADRKTLKSLKGVGGADLLLLAALIRSSNPSRDNPVKNLKTNCLSDEEIAAFIEKKKNCKDYDRIIKHLASCDSCRRLAAGTQRMLGSAAGTGAGVDLKARAFEGARRAVSRKSLIRPGFTVLAAAAAVAIVSLAVLKVPTWMADRDIATVGLTIDSDRVDALALDDGALIKRIAIDAGSEMKSLAGKDDRLMYRYIMEKAAQDSEYKARRLASAGYCFFILKNSGSLAPEIERQAVFDMTAVGIDPDTSGALIRGGRFDDLYGDIKKIPSGDLALFKAGYGLSEIMYADRYGLLAQGDLLKSTKNIRGLPIPSLSEYLRSLHENDAGARAGSREKVRRELFSL